MANPNDRYRVPRWTVTQEFPESSNAEGFKQVENAAVSVLVIRSTMTSRNHAAEKKTLMNYFILFQVERGKIEDNWIVDSSTTASLCEQ